MRVFISADIEGVSGMVDWKDEDQFTVRNWMTEDVNSAIAGAFDGGATYVCVRDAHGSARNIVPDDLDPRAEFCRGWGPQSMMVEGVRDGFDLMILVGYHACAGTEQGTMSHSWSGILRGLSINGVAVGEVGLAAVIAGSADVPLVMVSGDNWVAAEVEALIPGVRTAVVKFGIRRLAGRCLPLEKARALIRDTAASAVSDPGSKPYKVTFPARVELSYRDKEMARAAARIPTVERSGDYSVASVVDSIDGLQDFFYCCNVIAGSVA